MNVPADPVERAWWHLELSPEHFYPPDEPAAGGEESPALDEDDWDDDDEDRTCDYCGGHGGDPWNDHILECPMCLGEGVRL